MTWCLGWVLGHEEHSSKDYRANRHRNTPGYALALFCHPKRAYSEGHMDCHGTVTMEHVLPICAHTAFVSSMSNPPRTPSRM